jgi:hypothetical protein
MSGPKIATPEDYVGGWNVQVPPSGSWMEVRHYGYENGYRDPTSIDLRASLDLDGSCHVIVGQGNEGNEDLEYLHFGSVRAIDDLIRQLQELKAIGMRHFADQPGGDAWREVVR